MQFLEVHKNEKSSPIFAQCAPQLSTCFMDASLDMTLPIQTKVGTPPEEEDWMIPPPQQPVVMPPKNNIRRDSDQKR